MNQPISEDGEKTLSIKDDCERQHMGLQAQRKKMIREFKSLRKSFNKQNENVKMQLSVNSF